MIPMSKGVRTAVAGIAMAAMGTMMFAVTPVSAQPATIPAESGAGGLGDKIMCAACVAGGLIAISGGLAVVLGIASSPSGQLAIIACTDACVNAYAE